MPSVAPQHHCDFALQFDLEADNAYVGFAAIASRETASRPT